MPAREYANPPTPSGSIYDYTRGPLLAYATAGENAGRGEHVQKRDRTSAYQHKPRRSCFERQKMPQLRLRDATECGLGLDQHTLHILAQAIALVCAYAGHNTSEIELRLMDAYPHSARRRRKHNRKHSPKGRHLFRHISVCLTCAIAPDAGPAGRYRCWSSVDLHRSTLATEHGRSCWRHNRPQRCSCRSAV